MRKLTTILIFSVFCFTLPACTHILKPYQPPVQQGNIITDDMVKQLKVGLTKAQVTDIFGPAVLQDTFDPDTWLYIYTFQPSRGPHQQKQLTIYFKNDRVSSFTVDIPPPNAPKKRRFL